MTSKKATASGAFLELFAQTGNVTTSAEAVGITRKTAYQWRNQDSDFAEAWDDAEQQSHDLLEAEAFRRAYEGVDDFKVGPNGQFVEMKRYSDTLTIFLLKARRPEKYRDNATLQVTGPGGGPVQIAQQGVSLVAVLDVLRAAGAITDGDGTGTDRPALPAAQAVLAEPAPSG